MKKGNLHVSVNSVFLIAMFLLAIPIITLFSEQIMTSISHNKNLLTGNLIGSGVYVVNNPPVINVSDFSVIYGTLVNISQCAYEPDGHNFTCSFSPPLDPLYGFWQTNMSDVGSYIIEINATDQFGANSSKNVTLIVSVPNYNGTCELHFEVFDDQNINVTWNNQMNTSGGALTNYTNFTLSYSNYLSNLKFNDSLATNVSGLTENGYYDATANTTEYRFYKLYASDGINNLQCNITFGKKMTYLTPDNGRWNYVSSPFIEQNTNLLHFTQSTTSLDYAYKYNHETGVFDFYSYAFSFGTLNDVNTGECLLVQPTNVNGELITVAGEVMGNISDNLTMDNGRWNYFGWVLENTTRTDAFSGYEPDLDYVYQYNHATGVFDFYSFVFSFGTITVLPAGRCSLVQPKTTSILYNYSAYP